MQSFYFIRHAQTEANLAQVMCGGGVDTPLTNTGIEQAHKAQEIFLSHYEKKPIQNIIHSDMQRTRNTASILNQSLNLPMVSYPMIKEHVVGDWEGKSWLEISEEYISFNDPPNGETFTDFKKRIYDGFNHVLATYQNPLIVAHGGVWRALISAYDIVPQSHPSNAVLYYFEYAVNQSFPWQVYHCLENGQCIRVDL